MAEEIFDINKEYNTCIDNALEICNYFYSQSLVRALTENETNLYMKNSEIVAIGNRWRIIGTRTVAGGARA